MRGIGRSACLLAVASSACAGPAERPQAGFLAAPPASGPLPDVAAPIPSRSVLHNGLTVLAFEKPGLPIVAATVIIRGGSSADPPDRPGTAGFLAEVMRAGTDTRSAGQIADAIETLGAELTATVGRDALQLSFSALQQNAGAVLDLVADVVQRPTFPAEEIERVRRRRLGLLAKRIDDPRATADRVFRRVLFGRHPYGHLDLGDRTSIEAIGRADLEAYFDAHVGPANAAVVVAGSLPVAAAVAMVEARFGQWRGFARAAGPPPPAPDRPGVVTIVDNDGAPQSQLRIGHLGVSRSHPDFPALLVCNAILGGSFSSRINMSLREEKGYTYGARSTFELERSRGEFVVATAVETSVTTAAIREVIREIETIRDADVTVQELGAAKSRYTASLPGHFQTAGAIAAMISGLYVHDLPLDTYRRLPAAIRAVTVADIRRVATDLLRPERLSVVVVGDADPISPGLEQLQRGPLQRRTPDGELSAPDSVPLWHERD